MSLPNNFIFCDLESTYSTIFPYQNINLTNYQQFSYPQYFWVDENYYIQTSPGMLSYTLQPFLTTDILFENFKSNFLGQKTKQDEANEIQTSKNQIVLRSITDEFIRNHQNQANTQTGAFSFFCQKSQNQKLRQPIIEKPDFNRIKYKKDLKDSQQISDKRQIQNIRYQKKNIEANVANKIYTYLKTCLKLGERSSLNLLKNKEKASVYYKVLEKLQKVKKQNIKREFLKGLISMQSQLPGYNKIAKELLKKGQSIQQFQYNIRVIIKNYLRLDAINSILTSKKMNPHLWKDHLQKIRELEEYLFFADENNNKV